MPKELELWQFITVRLKRNQKVMLLVVAESSGSSPGRQGCKMAIGADGELIGSIGGGVMEVNLVEQSRQRLLDAAVMSEPRAAATGAVPLVEPANPASFLKPQIHQMHAENASGMICSGKQTVIFKLLEPADMDSVHKAEESIEQFLRCRLLLGPDIFSVGLSEGPTRNADFVFEKSGDDEFLFAETIGCKNDLYIVGGGHCALALSELMSKMDFHISLFDDRPQLNTLEKNRFAHEIKIIGSYDQIGEMILSGDKTYVVVMTLGYYSDDIVIRQLLDKDFKYFGVLGSKAKMAALLKNLRTSGFPAEKLDRIHAPIGLPINSRTPEEIAVSIAAEIIFVKNAG